MLILSNVFILIPRDNTDEMLQKILWIHWKGKWQSRVLNSAMQRFKSKHLM